MSNMSFAFWKIETAFFKRAGPFQIYSGENSW